MRLCIRNWTSASLMLRNLPLFAKPSKCESGHTWSTLRRLVLWLLLHIFIAASRKRKPRELDSQPTQLPSCPAAQIPDTKATRYLDTKIARQADLQIASEHDISPVASFALPSSPQRSRRYLSHPKPQIRFCVPCLRLGQRIRSWHQP